MDNEVTMEGLIDMMKGKLREFDIIWSQFEKVIYIYYYFNRIYLLVGLFNSVDDN